MTIGSTAISSLTGAGAPKPGVTTTPTSLIDDATRSALGLPAVTAPKKQSLDGTANGLGKDDFLKLLLAQLSNQDPLKPLEDKEFIAQLAQFNTLEQMQQANKHLADMLTTQSLSQASSMLGKQIETANGISGAVTAITMVDGQPKLTVGEDQVALADVVRVLPGTSLDGADDTTDTDMPTSGTAGTPATAATATP
jgi:flagellar basal-body rod modification protein FlgD